MSRRHILMLAGGTGGHVFPALALAKELAARGCTLDWVGSRRGLEARVLAGTPFTLHTLPVLGFRGKSLAGRARSIAGLLAALLESLRLLRRLRPGCVVGMGGYVAGPAGVAAWLLRRPLLIHEQNAVAGTTNRLLAPRASAVAAGFAEAFRPGIEARVVGNPVRAELVARAAVSPWRFDGDRPLRLLVLGGSLGAGPLNRLMPELLSLETVPAIELWHQCGERHEAAVRAAYERCGRAPWRLDPFLEAMAEAYAWADLVLARAGALTIAELAVMGRPALLVPLPHAIDDHQAANARHLERVGAARLLPQEELTAEQLARILRELAARPDALATMAEASRNFARPEATAILADMVEALARD